MLYFVGEKTVFSSQRDRLNTRPMFVCPVEEYFSQEGGGKETDDQARDQVQSPEDEKNDEQGGRNGPGSEVDLPEETVAQGFELHRTDQ